MSSVVYVHTSKRMDEELQNLCRDERCTIKAVHLNHEIIETRMQREQRYEQLGWRRDPLERIIRIQERKTSWRAAHCGHALQSAIIHATSRRRVKIFAEVYQNVLDDYGTVTDRSVYRHIDQLLDRGRIVRVSFDGNLSGYLRPRSPLLNDPYTMRQQIDDALAERGLGDDEEKRAQRVQRAAKRRAIENSVSGVA